MLTAKEIMTREPITVTPETDIAQAVKILLEKKINGLPVVDENKNLIGILCQSDLVSLQKKFPLPSVFTFLDGFFPTASLKNLEKEMKKISAVKVEDAMTKDPKGISLDTAVEDIASLMVDKKYHTLPVVEDGKLVGIVGKEDVLRSLIPDQ